MRFRLHQSGPWIGVGGILTELFIAFPVFFSVITVPASGIALIVALLLGQLIALARLARSRPERCVWVPVVGLVAYFVLVFAGARWLGWSA